MSTMPDAEVFVTLGIDTHKHTHLAGALDQLGRRLGQLEIPTTTVGFAQLYAWASEHGTIDTVGIEGTGAYGAGLCRWLRERGVVVVEVEFRSGDEPDSVAAATRYAMKKLAALPRAGRRDQGPRPATHPSGHRHRPQGRRPARSRIHTSATLLVCAGDNPERLRFEGAFARLTGTAPIPASSGQTDRFRLSRGGDRQANAALHLIAVNRLLCDPRSKAYVIKRTGGTKANLDILRRLKRYTARELHPLIVEALHDAQDAVPRAA
jgi:transposase